MSKLLPFAETISGANTVNLLSNSSDDENLCGMSSFANVPSDSNEDDEDDKEVQFVMVKKKPVSHVKNMPPPFAAFSSTEGKATYLPEGVPGNSKSRTGPEKLSKSKQNRNARLKEATLYYEMDPTFESVSTSPGPGGHVYCWLRTQHSQIGMYHGFLWGDEVEHRYNGIVMLPSFPLCKRSRNVVVPAEVSTSINSRNQRSRCLLPVTVCLVWVLQALTFMWLLSHLPTLIAYYHSRLKLRCTTLPRRRKLTRWVVSATINATRNFLMGFRSCMLEALHPFTRGQLRRDFILCSYKI
jgi:hypothetical protein